jgi:hypothetical protein
MPYVKKKKREKKKREIYAITDTGTNFFFPFSLSFCYLLY